MLDQRILDTFQQQNRFDLMENLIMACRVGSHSHGTHDPKPGSIDDTDFMLVVLPPVERLLGLSKWEHWTMQQDELDVVAYSLEKYVRLVLKANPNVVGTLWLRDEDYLFRSFPFKMLQEQRHRFSSMEAYNAFAGYAYAQLKRLEGGACRGYMGAKRKELVKQFGYDPKNASHLIRLYRMGIEFVQTGTLNVFRPDAEELKTIKRGKWSLEQVRREADRLEAQMQAAKETSPLPKQPDYLWAEEFLVNVQRKKIAGFGMPL